MDDQNLRAFITVAETGSFSQAADVLYLTQSAISKRISALEQLFGKPLFDRISRRVSLTEAGITLLPRARLILQEYADAKQAIDDLSGAVAGNLRLAISHHLGLHRLPPLLKIYAQEHGSVTLDIEFMDSERAYERVLHGEFEVGVITLALDTHENIRSAKVWDDPLYFVASKEHPLARLKNPGLSDLCDWPVILPGLNTYTGRIIQNLFREQNVPLSSPMSTNYLETIGTMVEIGLGWSVLPESISSNLQRLPVRGIKVQRNLGYIHHRKKSLSNAARAFLELLDSNKS